MYLCEKVTFNETVKRWMEYLKKERNSLLYGVDELYIHLNTYKIEQNSALAMNDEVPSGIICDAVDILYILEMNLAFLCGTKGVNLFL